MTLEHRPDGTYVCNECQFIFGENFVKDLADKFDGWHYIWHNIVMVTDEDGNVPERFRDISNGE